MNEQRDIFTVSRLNRDINLLMQSSFPAIWLEGEISNLARPASGHLYFSLKDSQAQVRAALFRNQALYLRMKPVNGMHVLVRARISLYEPRGDFQIIIEHMEETGDGALQRAFEALKAKLSAEGLFDLARKKTLPAYPQRVGIITSASGAALRDVLSVLQRRCPMIQILIYPVAVQGANAAKEIVQALSLAAQRNEVDALLLVRGGGSLEDLQAFNDEVVARAIAACSLPLISGIGHEIDFTIADLVADVRAATPSAGAELISPDQQEIIALLHAIQLKLSQLVNAIINSQQKYLTSLHKHLTLLHPIKKIQSQFQKLDELESRLHRGLKANMSQYVMKLSQLSTQLFFNSPINTIKRFQLQSTDLIRRLKSSSQQSLSQKRLGFEKILQALHTVSPLATLQRGYSIIRNPITNKTLTDSTNTKIGDTIAITLYQGKLQATVTDNTLPNRDNNEK